MIQTAQIVNRKLVIHRAPATAHTFTYKVNARKSDLPVLPATNLVPDERYTIPTKLTKHGFLYLTGPSNRKMFRVAPSLFFNLLAPSVPIRPFKAGTGVARAFAKSVSEAWNVTHPANYLSVKLADNHANVTIPMCVIPAPEGSLNSFVALGRLISKKGMEFTNQDFQDAVGDPHAVVGSRIPFSRIDGTNAPPDVAKRLLQIKKCQGEFEVAFHQGHLFLLAHFEVSKEICQHMTNSPWVQIRPIDLYGPLYSWVNNRLGLTQRPARFSIPLVKIASTLPAGGRPRLNEDDLLIDSNGTPLYIPREVDNINRYDSALADALLQDDGSYSLRKFGDTSTGHKPLPPSQPVFVDWLNLKFAYTGTTGMLMVMGLDRCSALNQTHIVRVLNRGIHRDDVKSFVSQVSNLNTEIFGGSSVHYHDMVNGIVAAINQSGDDLITTNDVILRHIYECQNSVPQCATIVEACDKILDFAKNNIENLYARYSVMTMCRVIAYATILGKYAKNYAEIEASDRESRRVYLDQGASPDYQPPSLPYISDKRGLLPHQFKVTNVLRDSPDFAILPVDAGGGKTMLTIVDILKEFKSGAVRRALVMCPGHLVKDYVREFVYATDGRINTIPVTTYTLRTHTVDGLFKMIESAPINTVVICDYYLANSEKKAMPIGYGTSVSRVYPVVDMLRRLNFDYVLMDESHYLKNESSRQEAVNRLISDIPKRRLASGTMVSDTIRDFPKQIGLLDPTIFGSQSDFVEEYALEVRGDKVVSWKPGAELALMSKIKSNVVVAGAKRREWNALLPTPIEKFHNAELSENQQNAYRTILDAVVEDIKLKIAEGNAKLKALLTGEKSESEDGEDDEVEDEFLMDSQLESLMRASLSRLEQFVTDPGTDKLGASMLSGEDLVSPKVRKIIEICENHIDSNVPGKILIFTNYHRSAKAIYDAFPPNLRAQAIYYTADRKDECGSEFEKDASKKIMVGVEYSMNTGLNLQFCSRLIRVETLWTPGMREQGDSRIGRPNIKAAEGRKEIYYDWVIANRTIDVTKISYLIAKTISKAKADNAGDHRYDNLETPDLIPMTLDLIRETSDMNTALLPYFNTYNSYKQLMFQDYKEYREQHPEALNDDGSIKLFPIEKASYLPDSKLMTRVPYVPGTELYKSENLGLIRFEEFVSNLPAADSSEYEEMDDFEDEEGDDDDTKTSVSQKLQNKELSQRLVGMPVHTEYGDGEVIKVTGKHVIHVRLSTGHKVKLRRMSVFFITRTQTNSKDMRTLLLQQHGDLPMTEKITVLDTNTLIPVKGKKGKMREEVEEQDDSVCVELDITVANDMPGLSMRNVADNPEGARALESLGFKHPIAYAYVDFDNKPEKLGRFAKKMFDSGFKLAHDNNEACRNLFVRLQKLRKNAVNLHGIATQIDLRNFYRMQIRPNPDPNLLMPYPLIQDKKVYLAFPIAGHPATRKAISKVRVPGVRWYKVNPKDELVGFVISRPKLEAVIKKILAKGIIITNLKELNQDIRKLRRYMDAQDVD